MNIQDVRDRAKDFGIKTSRMSKLKLIQAIQLEEGNFSCFASAIDSECDQMECIWRDDCFASAKKLHS
jgi:hypothetical protein